MYANAPLNAKAPVAVTMLCCCKAAVQTFAWSPATLAWLAADGTKLVLATIANTRPTGL